MSEERRESAEDRRKRADRRNANRDRRRGMTPVMGDKRTRFSVV